MTPYVELHCHSHYSLLDGASSPEALVRRAADLGMSALALTDHNAVYGAVEFTRAARAAGIKPVLGAELTLDTGHHLTLLVRNATGWGNLAWLISQAQAAAPKGEARLPAGTIEGHTEGLIVLSGCRQGAVASALLRGDTLAAQRAARWLCDRFGAEQTWIELQHHLLPGNTGLARDLVAVARKLRLPCVVTNNVHYAGREEHELLDVMACIRSGVTLDQSSPYLRVNSEFYLKSGAEMARLFGEIPEALRATLDIAERCEFVLEGGLQDLPLFAAPGDLEPATYLRRLCEVGISHRYRKPSRRVMAQLNHELSIIERSGLVNYFLIVWDVVHFAREQGILCQGRGSACNSLVAYLLGISPIDPLEHQLVFERFLSDERRVVPDIDIDFAADRREKVIQYIYERYGRDHVAMACTFSTFQARGALRDVGKVLGIPPPLVERVAKQLDGWRGSALDDSPGLQTLRAEGAVWKQLLDLSRRLVGTPRHLGLHNGGMIVTRDPIATRVPVEPAAMPMRSVVQWDKDGLEEVGMVKLDILGLRMLSVIAEAVEIIESTTGKRPDLQSLRFRDRNVYRLLCRADTIGVFQVESRAQAQVLPRLKPECFNDLVISISLIRPGPIQGEMVHPYLRRRSAEEGVLYAHPLLEPALSETLGVILFQEQVLKVARDLAGFSAGQGELLRRALGKKHATEAIERFRRDFLRGARKNGVHLTIAEEVFEQLKGFGSYSFAKSHAAAFAVLVYWSAWLKLHHHAAFSCALLNHQPMGFWSPFVLLNDARRHGVRVMAVDVNESNARCEVVDGALQLGLSYVSGLGVLGSERMVAARGCRLFSDLMDLCRRTQLPRRLVEHLIRAGAMECWGRARRDLLWELGALNYQEEELELAFSDEEVLLPPLTELEAGLWEREMTGVMTGSHLMAFYRAWLAERGVLSSRETEHVATGSVVRVAGEVQVHQAPPTAKGVHFVTLDDEFGMTNVVVKAEVYNGYREMWRHEPLLIVEGTVQRRHGVSNLVAQRVVALRQV